MDLCGSDAEGAHAVVEGGKPAVELRGSGAEVAQAAVELGCSGAELLGSGVECGQTARLVAHQGSDTQVHLLGAACECGKAVLTGELPQSCLQCVGSADQGARIAVRTQGAFSPAQAVCKVTGSGLECRDGSVELRNAFRGHRLGDGAACR